MTFETCPANRSASGLRVGSVAASIAMGGLIDLTPGVEEDVDDDGDSSM